MSERTVFVGSQPPVYLEQAVDTLRAAGLSISEELLTHLSPLGWEHIILTGEDRWHRWREGQVNDAELSATIDGTPPLAAGQPTLLRYSFPEMMS